jgi:transcription antitermination factor NusG
LDNKNHINKYWFVIQTKALTEKKVYANLLKKEMTLFLPLVTTVRQWSDRKKTVQVPLIPNVVFIYCLEEELKMLFYEPFVFGVLKFLKRPAVVKDHEIHNLKILINGSSQEEIVFVREILKPGDLVEVIKGPFMGLHGESIEFNGKHRIRVRIDALSTECLVSIPISFIRSLVKQTA